MDMATLVTLAFTLLMSQGPTTEKLGELPGISQPHSLQVVGDDLVFLDGFTVRVYSLHPLAEQLSFAGQGDGRDEFKYWPRLQLHGDTLVGLDYTKTSWYSLHGELLKTVSYSDFEDFDPDMEMLLIPAGTGFVRISADHANSRRFVQLFGPSRKPVKTLYEGLYDWRGELPTYRIDVAIDAAHIVVSDSEKGFFLSVFSLDGTLLRTIDRSADMEAVPFTQADRASYLESVKATEDPRLYDFLSQNGRFRNQFPLINYFQIDGGKLYVTTERTRRGNHELMVLDLQGRTLDTLFVPLRSKNPARRILRFDPYVIHDGKLYEIIRNESTGVCELWVTYLTR